jgi:hypothetical protein
MKTASYKYAADLDEALAIGQAFVDRLSELQYDHGKRLKRDAVFATWSDPDQIAEYPSIAVIMPEEGEFDQSQFVPSALEEYNTATSDGSGMCLWQDCEFVCTVQLVIICTDPIQRALVTRAVREALQDETGRQYGIKIPLKRYFGGVFGAQVACRKIRNEDSGEDAKMRKRKAILTVNCRFPMLRAVSATNLMGIDVRFTATVGNEALEPEDPEE